MKMLRALLALCLLCPSIFAQDPEVDTNYGTVRGKAITLDDGSVIDTFMAVPFAKPPVGELRFTISEDPEPWEGVLDAFQPGPACVQEHNFDIDEMSENCLHMNIYSPQRDHSEDLFPVMVYIYGGSYVVGVNYRYPGYMLARKGVVVVTLNYRLDLLGFAFTGDGEIAGNMGLMDQVQGLRFVQENIAAFGGDPNAVTIFGESAGAGSVAQLILMPSAAGLFHGAIMESGTEFSGWAFHLPDIQPENFIFDVAQQFGCPQFPTTSMVECLRGVDAYALQVATYTCPPGQNCWESAFVPVIDGVFFPDTPRNIRDSGEYNMVPEIVGINEKDGFDFLYYIYRDVINGLTRERFNELIENRANHLSDKWPNTTNTQDIIEAFKFFYADWPYYDDVFKNRDMLGYMSQDEFYGYPADLQAKLHSCYHGLDLYTVFGWPFMWLEGNEMAFNHSQLTYKKDFTEQDLEYSDFMMTMWTNFAKYGNPTPDGGVGPNDTSIIWPVFTPDELNYINLQLEPFIAKDLRQDYYAFWTEYLPYLIYDVPITGEL